MDNYIKFCHICETELVLVSKPERKFLFRPGIELNIPTNFPIATCNSCGEEYYSNDELKAIEELLEPEYFNNLNIIINKILKQSNITIRELERAVAVNPNTLIKASTGTEINVSVFRLLEVFSKYPETIKQYINKL